MLFALANMYHFNTFIVLLCVNKGIIMINIESLT